MGWKGGWILVQAGASLRAALRVSQINEYVVYILHSTDRVDYLLCIG